MQWRLTYVAFFSLFLGCGVKISETRTPYTGVDAQFCRQSAVRLNQQNYPKRFSDNCTKDEPFRNWVFQSIVSEGWVQSTEELSCEAAFKMLTDYKRVNKEFPLRFTKETPCFESYISFRFN